MKRKMFLKVKEKSLLVEMMFHFFFKKTLLKHILFSFLLRVISGKHLNFRIKKDTAFHIHIPQNKQAMHRISPTFQVFLNYVLEFKNISETGRK